MISSDNSRNISDPYAVLNVSRDADSTELRKAYTALSRAFHPDKQKVTDYDQAEDAFLLLKSAYDILNDPILRAAYDEYGMEGVNFLRNKASQSSREVMEYFDEADMNMDKADDREEFRDAMNRSMQFERYQNEMNKCPSSGKIQVSCNVDPFLKGRSQNPLEMDDFLIHFNVGAPASAAIGGKTSMTFGGYSMVKNGIGNVAAQATIEHEIQPGTEVGLSVDTGSFSKLEINTSRKMAGGTFISANANLGIGGTPRALTFASQRMLFRDRLFANFSVSTDNKINLTTTYLANKLPLYRMSFAMHSGDTSLDLSGEHKFDKGHNGKVSLGFALSGFHIKAMTTQMLSRFSTFGIGIKLHSQEGLTWILKLQRGGFSFNLPLTLCTTVDPFLSIFGTTSSIVIDNLVGRFVAQSKRLLNKKCKTKTKTAEEERELLDYRKSVENASIQTKLMSKQAASKRKIEEEKDGLVILAATYEVENGESLDVRIQLQFWVNNSTLKLPPTSKSNLMGFYDVSRKSKLSKIQSNTSSEQNLINVFRRIFFFQNGIINMPHVDAIPTLTVRYKLGNGVFEVSITDEEILDIPCPTALRLGDSNIIT